MASSPNISHLERIDLALVDDMVSVRGLRLFLTLSLIISGTRALAVVDAPKSCKLVFYTVHSTLAKADEGTFVRQVPATKKPQAEHFKFDEKQFEYFSAHLSQSDRATIFFNLIDSPDMVIGSLAGELRSRTGVIYARPEIDLMQYPEAIHAGRVYYGDSRTGYRDGSIGPYSDTEADFFLKVLDYGSRIEDGQTSVRFPLMLARKQKTEASLSPLEVEVEIPLKKWDYETHPLMRDHYEELKSLTHASPLPELRHLRPFFDWLHARADRYGYAKAIVAAYIENSRYASARPAAIFPESSLMHAFKPRRWFKDEKTRSIEAVRNYKLQIGYAIGALSDHIDRESAVKYEFLTESLDRKYAVAMKEIAGNDVVIEGTETAYYDSLRAVQMTSAKLTNDISGLNKKVSIFLARAQTLLTEIESKSSSSHTELRAQQLQTLEELYREFSRARIDHNTAMHVVRDVNTRLKLFGEKVNGINDPAAKSKFRGYLNDFSQSIQKMETQNRAVEERILEFEDVHQSALLEIMGAIPTRIF